MATSAASDEQVGWFSRAHPLALLAAAAGSLALGGVWPAAIAGAVVLGVHVALHRGRWTESGRFGAANALTTLRLALMVGLVAVCEQPPGPAAALLVVVIFALDGLDGLVARRRGEASAFGASFDMESDALFVLLCALELHHWRRLGPFILIPGLIRYIYAALIAWLPGTHREAPRSRIGRYVFSVLVLSFAASMWPLEPIQTPLAWLATLLILYSFAHSFYWSFKPA
jgi:phosphatidylglycerophosphate synthase